MTDAAELPGSAVAALAHCPDALYYLIGQQVWARVAGNGTATIGITALGIALAGDIYMCRPKRVGSGIVQGGSVAVVELAKSIVSVKSPVSGVITEVNPLLEDAPELVHRDPYGKGWLVRLRPTDWAADTAQLVHGHAVMAAMEHHAWLERAQTR